MHSLFPAPKGYEHSPKANAWRAMRAAERLAAYLDAKQGGHTHSNRLEEMEWYENYWDDSSSSELGIYRANWNTIDTYNRETYTREDVPGGSWPDALFSRLEKLGAECVWSDEHSDCSECGKLIRTEHDSFSWRPDFHVGDGEIVCIGCLMDNVRGAEDVIEGIAQILWSDVWTDMAEKAGHSLSGCDILEVMDPIPTEAYTLAHKVWNDLVEKNTPEPGCGFTYNLDTGACDKFTHAKRPPSAADILEKCMRADMHETHIADLDDYARRFGQCVAYRAMGAGVSWEDDHSDPEIEWSEMLICGSQKAELEDLASEALDLVWDEDASDWVPKDEDE